MKSLLTYLLLFVNSYLIAQDAVSISAFTVKSIMPSHIADWPAIPGGFLLVAQMRPNSTQDVQLKLQLKKEGNMLCGNNNGSLKAVNSFTVKNFTATELVAILNNCSDLSPGNYSICVQFFNADNFAISREQCREFRVENTQIAEGELTPPTALQPVDGAVINGPDINKPISFRWTPVLPRPQNAENILYSLQIFEIQSGQTATTAVKGMPLIEREIKGQTQLVVNDALLKKAGMQLAWQINASLNGRKLGSSSVMLFSTSIGSHVDVSMDSVACKDANGKHNFVFKLHNGDFYSRNLAGLSVYSINGTVQTTQPVLTVNPPIGSAVAANSSQIFNGSIVYNGNLQSIVFTGTTSGGTPPLLAGFSFEDTLECVCSFCKEITLQLAAPNTSLTNNGFKIRQPVSASFTAGSLPVPVKNITAEISWFEMNPTDTLCYRCEKDDNQFGKIIQAGTSINGFSNSSTLPGGSVSFIGSVATPVSNQFIDLTISAPVMLKCCSDKIKVCILYSITTADCKVCTIAQCYTINRN